MSESEVGVATLSERSTLRAFGARRFRCQVLADEAATKLALRTLVGSRLLVWLAGSTGMTIFGRNLYAIAADDPGRASAPFRAAWVNFLFGPGARWDSVWYLQIAHDGYFSRFSSAFFPLYPLLIHLGAGVFGSEIVVGMLISVLAMGVALYFLYLLARIDLGDDAARATVLLVAFFPTALFLSAVYTESLFLALSVGSIYAARTNRWAIASVLGALAAASRPNGLLVLVPLVVLFLYGPATMSRAGLTRGWGRPRHRLSLSFAWLGLLPLAVVAYPVYLWIVHNAPLAPFQVQWHWARQFAGPFGATVKLASILPHDLHLLVSGSASLVHPGDPLSWAAHDLVDFAFLIFAALGLAFAWRRLPVAYLLYALVMLAQSLSYPAGYEPLASFPRYVLVIFPLFMGWGAKLAGNRLASRSVLVVSATLLAGFSGLFACWAWVA